MRENRKKSLLDCIEETVLVVTLLAMVIINFGNVLGRYAFHWSWAFTERITSNLLRL